MDEKNLEALVCQYYKCGEQIAMAIVACAVKTGNIKNLEEKVGSSDRSDEE